MKAVLYRMVTKDHICPYGMKSKALLENEGYQVEDHHLTTPEETKAFKEKHQVKTTPQAFIDERRIGGFDDLVTHFGKFTLKQKGTTYQPIIALFVTTFLMALALVWSRFQIISPLALLEHFIAVSMCVLAILKLRDLFSFTNQFITYDILAGKFIPYAYIYPFAEAFAGIGMLAQVGTYFVASIAIFIGSIGGVSVIKAVYIEKRDIKCACVGGDSNVPLGAISLTENVMMFGMGCWMIFSSVFGMQ